MEPVSGYVPSSGSFDKTTVLDVKPLRCVAPVSPFPSSGSQAPYPPFGFPQSYPFFNQARPQNLYDQGGPSQPADPVYPSSVNGDFGSSKKVKSNHLFGPESTPESSNKAVSPSDEHGYTNDWRWAAHNMSGGNIDVEATSNGDKKKQKKNKATKRTRNSQDNLSSQDGDTATVRSILMKYDALKRRFAQVEEAKEESSKRPDLKAGSVMLDYGVRTNMRKRIGAVPGVEVGDIYFFRMELCVVGLHAPSMAGIDYMTVKCDQGEEPLAVSIVSSGGYEDEVEDGNVLIYSGQGGVPKKDGREAADQKLERGNLALERSLHRSNEVRVIRGVKDVMNPTGKVYIYDGLYKIRESWTEKGKSGCNVFKYKLVRLPQQPEAYTVWKSIQQWRDGVTSRPGIILPDLTSGAEKLPVPLVNDIDGERGPSHFIYSPGLRYPSSNGGKPTSGCNCNKACLAKYSCSCVQKNGGDSPYAANGLLVIQKPLIQECGSLCSCYSSCRSLVSQNGLKVRLEVFKTKDKGWGLRSWDSIRAGTFICEYAGQIIDGTRGDRDGDDEDEYIFDTAHLHDYSSEWNYPPELLGEERRKDLNEEYKPPIPMVVSAKNFGNVGRFINHSCSPNVFCQLVLHGHSADSYPHVIFYALKSIPPLTELTYEYGARGRRKKCLCGSPECKGYFGS